jgi:hypothetical protein
MGRLRAGTSLTYYYLVDRGFVRRAGTSLRTHHHTLTTLLNFRGDSKGAAPLRLGGSGLPSRMWCHPHWSWWLCTAPLVEVARHTTRSGALFHSLLLLLVFFLQPTTRTLHPSRAVERVSMSTI